MDRLEKEPTGIAYGLGRAAGGGGITYAIRKQRINGFKRAD